MLIELIALKTFFGVILIVAKTILLLSKRRELLAYYSFAAITNISESSVDNRSLRLKIASLTPKMSIA